MNKVGLIKDEDKSMNYFLWQKRWMLPGNMELSYGSKIKNRTFLFSGKARPTSRNSFELQVNTLSEKYTLSLYSAISSKYKGIRSWSGLCKLAQHTIVFDINDSNFGEYVICKSQFGEFRSVHTKLDEHYLTYAESENSMFRYFLSYNVPFNFKNILESRFGMGHSRLAMFDQDTLNTVKSFSKEKELLFIFTLALVELHKQYILFRGGDCP